MKNVSYEWYLNSVKQGDFVYLDPPYHNTFTGYNKTPFGNEEQIRLRNFVKELTNIGCKVAVSNSDNEFIRQLYSDIPKIRFIEIRVKRLINSKPLLRKDYRTELLIINY